MGTVREYVPFFVLAVFIKTVSMCIPYAAAFFVGVFIERVLCPYGPMSIGLCVLGIAALVLTGVIFSYFDTYVSHRISFGIIKKLRDRCFEKIEHIIPASAQRKSSGDYERIINGDVDVFEWFYAHILTAWIATSLSVIIGIVCIAFLSIYAAILVAVVSAVMIITPLMQSEKAEKKGYELRKNAGELNAVIVDGILGMKDIISNQYDEDYMRRLVEKSRQFDRSRNKFSMRGMNEKRFTELMVNVCCICSAVLGFLMLEAPDMIMLLLIVFAFFSPLQQTIRDGTNYGFVFGAAKRVYDLLNETEFVHDDGRLKAQDVLGNDRGSGGANSVRIDFEKVGFTYPGEENPTLKDVCFSVKNGEITALVAPSGTGKTTLVNLLERFWDYDSGRITINGTDIKEIEIKELRRIISMVTQDIYLFNMSVLDNIRLAKPDASEEEIKEACIKANAWEFINELPKGLDTQIGERGENLSGGQRQRIALAQAILRDTPVIVLDEATSSLDVHNEVSINKTLNEIKYRKAILVIAHRQATIDSADKVVCLGKEDGARKKTGLRKAVEDEK